MPIDASEPTVIDATYPLWAFAFRTQGFGLVQAGQPGPADAVSAHATLVKYRVRDDGVPEMSPLPSDQVNLSVPDLHALAATDATVGAALEALVAAVVGIAREQGKL